MNNDLTIEQVLNDPEFFLDFFRGLPGDEPVGSYTQNCGCPIYYALRNYFPDEYISVGGAEQGIYTHDWILGDNPDFPFPPIMSQFAWNLAKTLAAPILAGQALKALERAINDPTHSL